MGRPITGINPKTLTWARERAGRTIEDVAETLKKDVDLIREWEAGTRAPTYVQLEKLAYTIYKRPIALFFFPEPPDEPDPKQAFRTLPDFEIEDLDSDTMYKVRDARAMQVALYELNDNRNPSSRKIFRELDVRLNQPVETLTQKVRTYLQIDLRTQKEWRTAEEALKQWRSALEGVGVFVFKNSFKQRDVSGFCLFDEEFPVVYVNNYTPFTRQTFTLFHELAHILMQTSGVTKARDLYIRSLTGEAKQIEIFCNAFAAQFLVPQRDFASLVGSFDTTEESIADLAEIYNVSREVILRRMLAMGLVDRSLYDRKVDSWIRGYKGRSAGDGGNYFNTQAAYLGEGYMRMAFRKYYQGGISLQELASYLKIKVSSVPGLEQVALAA